MRPSHTQSMAADWPGHAVRGTSVFSKLAGERKKSDACCVDLIQRCQSRFSVARLSDEDEHVHQCVCIHPHREVCSDLTHYVLLVPVDCKISTRSVWAARGCGLSRCRTHRVATESRFPPSNSTLSPGGRGGCAGVDAHTVVIHVRRATIFNAKMHKKKLSNLGNKVPSSDDLIAVAQVASPVAPRRALQWQWPHRRVQINAATYTSVGLRVSVLKKLLSSSHCSPSTTKLYKHVEVQSAEYPSINSQGRLARAPNFTSYVNRHHTTSMNRKVDAGAKKGDSS